MEVVCLNAGPAFRDARHHRSQDSRPSCACFAATPVCRAPLASLPRHPSRSVSLVVSPRLARSLSISQPRSAFLCAIWRWLRYHRPCFLHQPTQRASCWDQWSQLVRLQRLVVYRPLYFPRRLHRRCLWDDYHPSPPHSHPGCPPPRATETNRSHGLAPFLTTYLFALQSPGLLLFGAFRPSPLCVMLWSESNCCCCPRRDGGRARFRWVRRSLQ